MLITLTLHQQNLFWYNGNRAKYTLNFSMLYISANIGLIIDAQRTDGGAQGWKLKAIFLIPMFVNVGKTEYV